MNDKKRNKITHAFWHGWNSIFNISGLSMLQDIPGYKDLTTIPNYNDPQYGAKRDAAAFAKDRESLTDDWRKIGSDIRLAMDSL
jgi:hypothetical protein